MSTALNSDPWPVYNLIPLIAYRSRTRNAALAVPELAYPAIERLGGPNASS